MTDDEFNSLCERLVKGAEYLSNPIIKPDDYAKGMRIYDELSRKIEAHRRNHSAH